VGTYGCVEGMGAGGIGRAEKGGDVGCEGAGGEEVG